MFNTNAKIVFTCLKYVCENQSRERCGSANDLLLHYIHPTNAEIQERESTPVYCFVINVRT